MTAKRKRKPRPLAVILRDGPKTDEEEAIADAHVSAEKARIRDKHAGQPQRDGRAKQTRVAAMRCYSESRSLSRRMVFSPESP